MTAASTLLVAVSMLLLSAGPYTTSFDDDGAIIVNGARTFIIGSYYKGQTAEPYQELAGAGFNLVRTGRDAAEMDKANAAGLMVWTDVGALDLSKLAESEEALRVAVRSVSSHPALAFLETVDEPAWTHMKAEARIAAEALVRAYPIIKEEDARHLLYTNHAPTNLESTLREYNAGTDIVACDVYPVIPRGLKPMYALFEDGLQGDLLNEQISQTGEYAQKMRRITGAWRPVFMVLQGFAWEQLRDEKERDPEKVLYPTLAQSRFMAWQSVINGANGIVYWGSGLMPEPNPGWDGVKLVTREMADLAGPLSARTENVPLTLTYHELGRSVDAGVQWIARRHEDALYVFTCNADKSPCRVTIGGLPAAAGIEVLGENRTVPALDGRITEDWQPFEVHLYRIDAPKTGIVP